MKTSNATAPAHNSVHGLDPLPPILTATSPVGVAQEKPHPYESATPEGRRQAFNQIVDDLMRPARP